MDPRAHDLLQKYFTRIRQLWTYLMKKYVVEGWGSEISISLNNRVPELLLIPIKDITMQNEKSLGTISRKSNK